jgi:hypothetical protein
MADINNPKTIFLKIPFLVINIKGNYYAKDSEKSQKNPKKY